MIREKRHQIKFLSYAWCLFFIIKRQKMLNYKSLVILLVTVSHTTVYILRSFFSTYMKISKYSLSLWIPRFFSPLFTTQCRFRLSWNYHFLIAVCCVKLFLSLFLINNSGDSWLLNSTVAFWASGSFLFFR